MIEWWGPVIHEYYAGTEGNGFVYCNSERLARPPGHGGQGARRRDPHRRRGRRGAAGRRGRAPSTSRARRRRRSSTTTTPRRPSGSRDPKGRGWSTLGDVGRLDEDGFLYLTDRKAYMIITGGVNIYPQEAENVLALHPKVADVAVFGVPNEDFGEEVKAVVQPAEGVDAAPELERELIAYCREHLADVKCPRSVDFRAELPRHPTGKLYKRLLKDEYWAGRRVRHHLAADAPTLPTFLDQPGPIPFAHRGGASPRRPRTPCRRSSSAIDLGLPLPGDRRARHRRRRAGRLPRRPLDRVTDRTGEISELPWDEVQQARVDGREPIPLLEDVLGAWPDVRVNIDPKADAVGRVRSSRCCGAPAPSTGCASAPSPTSGSTGCATPSTVPTLHRSRPRRGGSICSLSMEGEAAARSARRACRSWPTTTNGRPLCTPELVDTPRTHTASSCTCGPIDDADEMARAARHRRGRDHDRPAPACCARSSRPGASGPDGAAPHPARLPGPGPPAASPTASASSTATARGPTPSSPSGATARPATSAASSACAAATSWPGCAATPTSCSRRTTACCWPAPCFSRSTSAWRRPSCGASSNQPVPPCSSATPTSPTRRHRCVRSCSASELRGGAGPPGRRPGRIRRPRRERPRRDLLHERLHGHAEGCGAHPPQPVPARRPQRAHQRHHGDDVILHLVPLFHVNGWGTPHYLTGLGGTHVMLPRFDAGEVLRLIEAHRVTRLFAVPAMVRHAPRPPRPRHPGPVLDAAPRRSAARR